MYGSGSKTQVAAVGIETMYGDVMCVRINPIPAMWQTEFTVSVLQVQGPLGAVSSECLIPSQVSDLGAKGQFAVQGVFEWEASSLDGDQCRQ